MRRCTYRYWAYTSRWNPSETVQISIVKHLKTLTLGVFLAVTAVGSVAAQSDTQVVTIVVADINEIAVSSGTLSLTINSATAGSNPDGDTDATTTYDITTNGSSKKITASLGSAYATGISLALTLGAPSGATSAGAKTLTTSAQDMVTGITKLSETGVSISYSATATAAAVSNGAGEAQTVTLTITS